MRHVPALHNDVGRFIDRVALLHQPPHHRFRIRRPQQRPGIALHHPPHQHRQLGAQPDRDPARHDRVARVGIHEGAPTGGQHLRPAAQQPPNHFRLTVPEMRLAILGEDIGDRHARHLLDLLVGIDERQRQPVRQPPPDCRFAAAHQPDHHQRSIADPANQLLQPLYVELRLRATKREANHGRAFLEDRLSAVSLSVSWPVAACVIPTITTIYRINSSRSLASGFGPQSKSGHNGATNRRHIAT